MARCPDCEREMREVSAKANPGQLIVLDQCPACGGIWCDRWELFPIAHEEGSRLDAVNEDLLRGVTSMGKEILYCPRCRDRLQLFNDPMLPEDVQLRRCRRCEGIWLNRGAFGRFKEWQKKTRGRKMAGDAKVRKVAQHLSDPKSWVTTGTKGIFAYPRGEDEAEDWADATAKGTVRLILQALLRLVWPL
jgi:Zn-finger nucleic acid-binding protein